MSKVCSASTSCIGYSIDVVQCFHDCVREEYLLHSLIALLFSTSEATSPRQNRNDRPRLSLALSLQHCLWQINNYRFQNSIEGVLLMMKSWDALTSLFRPYLGSLMTRDNDWRVYVSICLSALCPLTMCRVVIRHFSLLLFLKPCGSICPVLVYRTVDCRHITDVAAFAGVLECRRIRRDFGVALKRPLCTSA